MAWTWRFEKADGTEVPPAVEPEEFTTQGDAESWIGEEWRALLEGGADQAVLFDGDTRIYGPMSLHAETPADPEAESAADDAAAGGASGPNGATGAHLAPDDALSAAVADDGTGRPVAPADPAAPDRPASA